MGATAVSIARTKKDQIPFPAVERAAGLSRPVRAGGAGAAIRKPVPVVAERVPSTDEALLRDLRRGSAGAAEELFERFHGKVFHLAMSILKNQSDAEEATQDVFMTVIQKAGTFKGNSALSVRPRCSSCSDLTWKWSLYRASKRCSAA